VRNTQTGKHALQGERTEAAVSDGLEAFFEPVLSGDAGHDGHLWGSLIFDAKTITYIMLCL
jgi:hypothetical protein